MDTLWLYSMIRRQITEIKAQADRFSAKITAGTVNASDIHDGIRTNAFEVWQTRLRIFWDASDPLVDLTTQDYGFPAVKLASWGIDPAKLQAGLTERDRTKLIALWRADTGNGILAPAVLLTQLKASMTPARQFVIDNYPTGVAGEDQGLTIGPGGERVPLVFAGGQMAGLKPLLDDVSAKCAALLP